MWELLEGFFYYLKSKGKRLPTIISLILIALVLLFYFLLPSHPPLSIEPVKTIPLLEDKERPQEPKALKTPDGPLINSDESTPELPHTPSNEAEALALLDQYFRQNGLDPALSEKIYLQLRKDLAKEPPVTYDISEAIQKVLGPDAKEAEINQIKEITLRALTDSFDLYLAKNNIH